MVYLIYSEFTKFKTFFSLKCGFPQIFPLRVMAISSTRMCFFVMRHRRLEKQIKFAWRLEAMAKFLEMYLLKCKELIECTSLNQVHFIKNYMHVITTINVRTIVHVTTFDTRYRNQNMFQTTIDVKDIVHITKLHASYKAHVTEFCDKHSARHKIKLHVTKFMPLKSSIHSSVYPIFILTHFPNIWGRKRLIIFENILKVSEFSYKNRNSNLCWSVIAPQ